MTAKLSIEVRIISARGLRQSPSLLKPQWFAVCWIDPSSKYCTMIPSGNQGPNPKPKFNFEIDGRRSSNPHDPALILEIYRRDPIFLMEKFHGAATIMLREFFDNFRGEESHEEISSFQLRKRNSPSPRGFIDISVRVYEPQGIVESHQEMQPQRSVRLEMGQSSTGVLPAGTVSHDP
ncbi:hypothetical protein KSP39_PZI010476 [Platanthera zijinensis]|uniref:C2 domain-containing protein n=1 Tax=Platanthera zijinensis TaxID=2320716 RepID=A0AAP0BKE0_9ASPA